MIINNMNKKAIAFVVNFVIVLCLQASAFAQVADVCAKIVDPAFKSFCITNFDTNKDGVVSKIEAQSVTTIDVSYEDIQSLKGIELFPNITTLYCIENSLTSLDVSKNTELKELYCSKNRLTSLDISNNTALEDLSCDSNQLTSLDVSKNAAITRLNCSGNNLTSLDLSKNSALKWLNCGGNPLNSLDVSKNRYLSTLLCELPESSIKRKEILDVRVKMEDDSFKKLCIVFDTDKDGEVSLSEALQVKEIDCTYRSISSLKGIEVFENLTSLICRGNDLSSLDVSNNIALRTLDCSENGIAVLDVSKNTSLEELRCRNNNLTSLDVSKNLALKELYCNGNRITILNVSNNTALEYLNCGGNPLNSLDVSKNLALKELYCNQNNLTSLDVSKNTALEELQYSGNQLSSLNIGNNPALMKSRQGQRVSSSNSNSGTQFPRSVTSENKQTSLTTVVWATPAGNEVFILHPDGTADVKLDVSYRTRWEQDDDEFIFIGGPGTGTVKQWMLDSSTGSVFAVYASSVTQRPVARLVKR